MVNACETCAPALSVTWMVKESVPAVCGVPCSELPTSFRSPVLPDLMDQV